MQGGGESDVSCYGNGAHFFFGVCMLSRPVCRNRFDAMVEVAAAVAHIKASSFDFGHVRLVY